MKILDCTFRDGGYYNNWDFNDELVEKYFTAMSDSGVDIVELGFRYAPKPGYFGPYAYLSEALINRFQFDRYSFELAVMIEEPDISSFEVDGLDFIDKFFVHKSESQIDIVRIAVHFERAEKIVSAVKKLSALGYEVIVNLMQISRIPIKDVKSLLVRLRGINEIKALYFADSLGSMGTSDVVELCEIFKSSWSRSFGFHAHNNCGQAVENSIAAMANGCGYIDCTVTGMGRGAGNTLTESFLLRSGRCQLGDLQSLTEVVLDYFVPLRAKFGWGESLTYQIAARGQVHPTYVQTLETRRSDLKGSEVASIIGRLSGSHASSFSEAILAEAILSEREGTDDATNEIPDLSDTPLLLLGPGLSIEQHKSALKRYLQKAKLTLISCSVALEPSEWPFDYFICSSARARKFAEHMSLRYLDRIFVTPYPASSELSAANGNWWQYPLTYSEERFEVNDQRCCLGTYKSLIYAIAYCYAAGAREVFIAGFDGYGENDPRSIEMSNWLSRLTSELGIKVVSLLPTIYPTHQSSLYHFYV